MEQRAAWRIGVMGGKLTRLMERAAGGLLAAIGALALSACAQDAALDEGPGSAAMTRANDAPLDIFYVSQEEADADLARFDRENPQCQLWTNWQKMCSRTGEGTHCVAADSRRVRPSKVFCSHTGGGISAGPGAEATPRVLGSFFRYCDLPGGFDGSYEQRVNACEWRVNRPFNGRSKRELDHPWCGRWRWGPTASRQNRVLYCSQQRLPAWCNIPKGLGFGLQDDEVGEESQVTLVQINRDAFPVNGVHCNEGRVDAK